MYLSWLGYIKLLLVMYMGRAIPEHVKEPRMSVNKSKVLIPSVTCQIRYINDNK